MFPHWLQFPISRLLGTAFVGLLSLGSAAPAAHAEEVSPDAQADAYTENVARIFADDNVADIRVVFGYDDYPGFHVTKDRLRAYRLMLYLQARGFSLVPMTQHLADDLGVPVDAPNVRIYIGRATEGRSMRIAMSWSSATYDSAKNSGSGYAEQLKSSQRALAFMKKAASDAEVMLYVGHSRGGGGPDTYPPETKGRNAEGFQRTDYSYYRKNRPGLEALGTALTVSRDKPCIIGWTSCKSDNHFRGWFAHALAQKSHPTTLLLSTRVTSYMPTNTEIKDQDEALMACASLLFALQNGHDHATLTKNLKQAEIETKYATAKPAWKLVSLPEQPAVQVSAGESQAPLASAAAP